MKAMIRCLSVLLPLLAVSCHSGMLPGGAKSARACEVHHVKLEQKKVAILYGLPPPRGKNDPTSQETAARFPHRTRPVEGGCMVGSKTTTTRDVCMDCDAAYVKWADKRH